MTLGIQPEHIKLEIDFDVIKEHFVTIKLKDGSIIKLKAVMLKIFDTDLPRLGSHEMMHVFEGQNLVTVSSPEKLHGKPTKDPPPWDKALELPKEEIEVVETTDPGWNEYVLKDGKKVKTKSVITNVYKIKNIFDQHGNPYYVVMASTVASASPSYPAPSSFSQISEGDVLTHFSILEQSILESAYHQNPTNLQFLIISYIPQGFEQRRPSIDWIIGGDLVEDIKWLREHSKELQDEYPNMYIAVYQRQVIAADKEFGKVCEKVKPYGERAIIKYVFSGDLVVL
jgi:hypothetical protein